MHGTKSGGGIGLPPEQVSMTFSGFGEPVSITAPDASQVAWARGIVS